LTGAAVLFGRWLVTRVRLWRIQLQFGRVRDEALLSQVERVRRQLGIRRRVRVIESGALEGPFTFGVLRPALALPVDFSAADAAHRDVILLHELSHVARRDALWQALANFLCGCLWWQPLTWLARARFRAACELAADEVSQLRADGPALLAECLVSLGRRQRGRRPLAWLHAAGTGSPLAERVERLVAMQTNRDAGTKKPRCGPRLRLSFVLLLTASIVAAASGLYSSDVLGTKGATMMSRWKRSLAGLTVMAVLSPMAMADEREEPRDERERVERAEERERDEIREREERERDEIREREERERDEIRRREERERDEAFGRDRERREQDAFRRNRERGERERRGPERPPREREPGVPPPPEVRELHRRADELHAALDEALERLTEEHPRVRELQLEIRRVEAAIDETVRHQHRERTRDVRDPDERARRLDHLRVAIENLHAAGLVDQAAALERQLMQMEKVHEAEARAKKNQEEAMWALKRARTAQEDAQVRAVEAEHRMHAERARVAPPQREIAELHQRVDRLERELAEMRKLLEKIAERE
jgi:hypothetical protein